MTPAYRMVHFVPDPFLGGRVPVAAVVRHVGGPTVVRVPHLPGAECLGRASAVAAIRLVLDDLTRLESFDGLPGSVGPQCVLGDPREIPRDVADPVAWVTGLLGGVRDPRPTARTTHERQRVTSGSLFLKAWRVEQLVSRAFRPSAFRGDVELGPIAQYVQGKDELLLLEPLVPARTSWKEDLTVVTERFSAYKFALARGERLPAAPHFCAYVLQGGPDDRRAEIKAKLASVADDVVDTAKDDLVEPFIARIRSVAGAPEMPI